MSSRYVLFAAVYRSGPLALDGIRVLTSAKKAEVAGVGLLHRDEDGQTTLQRAIGATIARAALVGFFVGMAVGLGTRLMWVTALIGAVMGSFVGYQDRITEVRELGSLVGEFVPPGGYAVVAVADEALASRLSLQFDLAQQTRMIPIAGPRMRELARVLARGNPEVTRALDGSQG
ncbi:MAG: hypothetical protein WCF36_09300 [Candidatus Nanopelagicales bacterium]